MGYQPMSDLVFWAEGIAWLPKKCIETNEWIWPGQKYYRAEREISRAGDFDFGSEYKFYSEKGYMLKVLTNSTKEW